MGRVDLRRGESKPTKGANSWIRHLGRVDHRGRQDCPSTTAPNRSKVEHVTQGAGWGDRRWRLASIFYLVGFSKQNQTSYNGMVDDTVSSG